MRITCDQCNINCPTVARWKRHLLSKAHVGRVKANISLWTQETNSSENIVDAVVFVIKDIQPPLLRATDVINKVSSYGLVHDFYMSKKTTTCLVKIELSSKCYWKNLCEDWYGLGTIDMKESYSSEQWSYLIESTLDDLLTLNSIMEMYPSPDKIKVEASQGCSDSQHSRSKSCKSAPSSEYFSDDNPLQNAAKKVKVEQECFDPQYSKSKSCNSAASSQYLSDHNSVQNVAKVKVEPSSQECFDLQYSKSKSGNSAAASSQYFNDDNSVPEKDAKSNSGVLTDVYNDYPSRDFGFIFGLSKLGGFCRKFIMSDKDYVMRSCLLRNLEACLRVEFPDCRLHIFGSYLTKLGDSSSDLDVTITGCDGVPLNKTTEEGIILAKKIRSCLKKSHKRGMKKYDNIQAMLKSHIQVVRFVEAESQISCDLSIANLLAVRNSALIQFLLNFDSRVRPLAILVRYWGKFYKLTGSTKLKNYALILLLFVFLARKRILPTISDLQSLSDEEYIIDGWNAAFSINTLKINRLLHQKRDYPDQQLYEDDSAKILNLLLGFFEMLDKEDYEKNIICTLTAQSLPTTSFASMEAIQSLPAEFKSLKSHPFSPDTKKGGDGFKIKLLNIQDPFDLHSNLGKSVLTKCLMEKIKFIVHASYENLRTILSNANQHDQIDIQLLFPAFVVPVYMKTRTKSDEPPGEILSRIRGKLSPDSRLRDTFEALEQDILKNWKRFDMYLTEDFATLFFDNAEKVLGHTPGEELEIIMFNLWCCFAQQFISTVWRRSYFLDTTEFIFIDDIQIYRQNKHCLVHLSCPNIGLLHCAYYTSTGAIFPAGSLFGKRHSESGALNQNEDPLNTERRIRGSLSVGLGKNIRKGGKQVEINSLPILEISKESGPKFSLFFKCPNESTAERFILCGVKRLAHPYQMYLLETWISKGGKI